MKVTEQEVAAAIILFVRALEPYRRSAGSTQQITLSEHKKLLKELSRSDSVIVEALTIPQIAGTLSEQIGMPYSEFVALVNSILNTLGRTEIIHPPSSTEYAVLDVAANAVVALARK